MGRNQTEFKQPEEHMTKKKQPEKPAPIADLALAATAANEAVERARSELVRAQDDYRARLTDQRHADVELYQGLKAEREAELLRNAKPTPEQSCVISALRDALSADQSAWAPGPWWDRDDIALVPDGVERIKVRDKALREAEATYVTVPVRGRAFVFDSKRGRVTVFPNGSTAVELTYAAPMVACPACSHPASPGESAPCLARDGSVDPTRHRPASSEPRTVANQRWLVNAFANPSLRLVNQDDDANLDSVPVAERRWYLATRAAIAEALSVVRVHDGNDKPRGFVERMARALDVIWPVGDV